jgi:hypothetical protein
MIANSIAAVDYEAAAASIVSATNRIEADPTAWSSLTFSRKIL